MPSADTLNSMPITANDRMLLLRARRCVYQVHFELHIDQILDQFNHEHGIVNNTHRDVVSLKWAVVVGTARTSVSAALPE